VLSLIHTVGTLGAVYLAVNMLTNWR